MKLKQKKSRYSQRKTTVGETWIFNSKWAKLQNEEV